MANSSTTISQEDIKEVSNGVKIVTIDFVADDADGSFDNITLPTDHGKQIHSIVTTPGGTGPTDNSDLSITDGVTTVNLVATNGVDAVDNATVNNIRPDTEDHIITGPLTVAIANNSVNSAEVAVTIVFVTKFY